MSSTFLISTQYDHELFPEIISGNYLKFSRITVVFKAGDIFTKDLYT